MEESEKLVRPYGELGKYLHEYRLTSSGFMSPRKGFFDMGDIVALVDPEIGSWEETKCPELGWDRNGLLDYRFKGTLGSILRCYDMDRDKAFALLYSKLKTHYG